MYGLFNSPPKNTASSLRLSNSQGASRCPKPFPGVTSLQLLLSTRQQCYLCSRDVMNKAETNVTFTAAQSQDSDSKAVQSPHSLGPDSLLLSPCAPGAQAVLAYVHLCALCVSFESFLGYRRLEIQTTG